MKKIYIYMGVCILIGFLMMFRPSIRQMFEENLSVPQAVDLAWVKPLSKKYEEKTILELHYFNPRQASEVVADKLQQLRAKELGVRVVLLSGSPKIGTNTYVRELAKEDWGIEEIRLHGTSSVNIYAFINLIKANSSLRRIFIWNNSWDEKILEKIRSVMPISGGLKLLKN